MTTTTSRTARSTPVAAPASRAALAAAMALVVTFSPDRTAQFGLLVLGAYLVLQGVLLAAWTRRLARTRSGLVLLVLRAGVSLVGGAAALAQPDAGIDLLRTIEVLVFLLVGAFEVAGGVQRAEGAEASGDAIVVGGLQVVVGLMVVILNADARFSVGVLSAWAALVTVYLGIAAANLRVKQRRA